jgi:hypothetical protein
VAKESCGASDSKLLYIINSADVSFQIFIGLAILYHVAKVDDIYVIPRRTPPLPMLDQTHQTIRRALDCLGFASNITARAFQALLNYRASTFAGSYRPMIALEFMTLLVLWAQTTPAVVGLHDALPGMSLANAVITGLTAILTWQAVVLRTVPQAVADEEDE